MKISIYIACISLIFAGCTSKQYQEPTLALEDYKIEEGFDLEMIAAEPLLKAPVAMQIDDKGRFWVVEMPGFMENLEGKGESAPTGSIKILEDLDKDGVMDHSKNFLDSLVMPRALAMVYGGLLYAEPPKLWFVEIEDDQPGKRTLVDSTYAPEGNPEYQQNGLMLNIDNWIYSAKSNYRYQRKNGVWHKEPTSVRGQWGISHDNFGRLYYNDNSRQLLGDYLLPNRLIRNKYLRPQYGINQVLTSDQRVYPLHAAAVNRGYAEGVLDSDSLLIHVSAACSPLVYRGAAFSEAYDQNVFVCAPEANLIKRNVLDFHGDSTSAKQAWKGKEFLASTDEGFRPVSLYNGPDGALYVVDMHRGVIQHYAFLSPYLKNKARKENLDTITDFGRILKITKKGSEKTKLPNFETLSAAGLVHLLQDKNGWVRDRAQHYLIFKNEKEAIPQLKELALDDANFLAQIHALYALEGLDALSFDLLKTIAEGSNPELTSHAIVLTEKFISEENAQDAELLFNALMAKNDPAIDVYLATTLGTWAKVSPEGFDPIAYSLFDRYKGSNLFAEALVSGSGKTAKALLTDLEQHPDFKNSALEKQLTKNIKFQKEDHQNPIYSTSLTTADTRTRGAKLFRQICAACHGMDGEGIDGLAPPFVNSQYLAGPPERIGLIVLHGLSGPVHVNGKIHEFNQAMPGMASNASLSDEAISDVISYITNAFSRTPKYLSPKKIKELREQKPKNGGEYTEKELLQTILPGEEP